MKSSHLVNAAFLKTAEFQEDPLDRSEVVRARRKKLKVILSALLGVPTGAAVGIGLGSSGGGPMNKSELLTRALVGGAAGAAGMGGLAVLGNKISDYADLDPLVPTFRTESSKYASNDYRERRQFELDKRRPIDPAIHALAAMIPGGSLIAGTADSKSVMQGLRQSGRSALEGVAGGLAGAGLGGALGYGLGSVGKDGSRERAAALASLLGMMGAGVGGTLGNAHGGYAAARNYNKREFGIGEEDDERQERKATGRVIEEDEPKEASVKEASPSLARVLNRLQYLRRSAGDGVSSYLNDLLGTGKRYAQGNLERAVFHHNGAQSQALDAYRRGAVSPGGAAAKHYDDTISALAKDVEESRAILNSATRDTTEARLKALLGIGGTGLGGYALFGGRDQ